MTRKSSTRNIRRRRRIIENIQACILMLLLFFILPGIAGWYEIHYKMDAQVKQIIGDEIIIEDTTGNVWSFKGDGYIEGDRVRVTFCTMGTDSTRRDDEIEQVKVIKE